MATVRLSNIDVDQKTPENYRLLQARQWYWRVAVRWQIAQFVIVVLISLTGAIIAALLPEKRPIVGAVAVVITILDVAFLDRTYRGAIKMAARASEHFDVAVLQLPWNRLSAGEKLPPEELADAATKWQAKHPDDKPTDWYPASVARAPAHVARVICQRVNVTYDSALRRYYASVLVYVVIAVSAAIVGAGLWRSLTLADLVLSALVPVAPLLVWSLRDAFRQRDAATANDAIQSASEAVLRDVIAGACDEPTCVSQSVQLQSALFARRSTNPLVFPGLYKWLRSRLEQRMDAGAEYWLQAGRY